MPGQSSLPIRSASAARPARVASAAGLAAGLLAVLACGHDWSGSSGDGTDGESSEAFDGDVPSDRPDEATNQDGDEGSGDGRDVDDAGDLPDDAAEVPVTCGDGIVQAGEECDDGNDSSTDACLATCRAATCGDGWVWEAVEVCEGSSVPCTSGCDTIGWAACVDCSTIGGCAPPAETCNGADDDCDTEVDDGFPCRLGEPVTCTTGCLSTGLGTCSMFCEVPPADECMPPAEACGNGVDDDCDTEVNEGCSTDNDTCAGALNITGGGTFTGSTAGMADDSGNPLTCTTTHPPADAPDAYFYFDLTGTSDVFLHSSGSSFDTVLYVDPTCGDSDTGCNDDVWGEPVDRSSALVLPALAPGRYYVTLDGYHAGEDGPYSLAMYATPADVPGDRCGHPIPIPPGTDIVEGYGCDFSDELVGRCPGFGDAVYYFTLDAGGTVAASACTTLSGAPATLSIRSDCLDATSEVVCDDMGRTCTVGPDLGEITATLGPGLYFLVVENGRAGRCDDFGVELDGI